MKKMNRKKNLKAQMNKYEQRTNTTQTLYFLMFFDHFYVLMLKIIKKNNYHFSIFLNKIYIFKKNNIFINKKYFF